MTKCRIMGGMFGLEPGTGEAPSSLLRNGDLLLVNARSAFLLLAEQLKPGRVWLPSYLCGVVPYVLAARAVPFAYYPVDRLLRQTSADWLCQVRPGDVVVLVDYFGLPCDPAWAKSAQECGAWVVEDACQALLTEGTGRDADFVVFSPRKFFGVPDGGILRDSRAYLRHWSTLIPPPAEWWLACLEATTLRRDFDRHGGERRWYELFRQTQDDAPAGPFAMSRLTQALLSGAVDAALTARRRRHNYRCLAEQLGELALFPELPAGVAPLGFPVCLAERDRVRQRLFARRIYPPVHWPLDGVVPTEFRDSHLLAREIMTLPCDQRYDPDDMDALAAAVKEAL